MKEDETGRECVIAWRSNNSYRALIGKLEGKRLP
jgi:hypothetical protein